MLEELLEDRPEQITSSLVLEMTQKDERNTQQKNRKTKKKRNIFRNEINSIKTNSFSFFVKKKISAQIILGGKKMFEFSKNGRRPARDVVITKKKKLTVTVYITNGMSKKRKKETARNFFLLFNSTHEKKLKKRV